MPKYSRRLVRIFLRNYIRTALVVLGVFGVVGLFHPGFFFYGMRHLTTVLADTVDVQALVLPPPEAPTLTTSLSCNPLNLTMALDLDWTADTGGGTFTYDIYRNGSLMAAGLPDTTHTYLDTSLAIATAYTYKIRANGPMGPGFEDSNEITLTTPYNCDGLTPPTVAVTMFNGRPLASYRDQGLYNTTRRRPAVVGTSNIPYADVEIVINTETRLVAHVTANINGYWEWQPAPRLNYERSVMTITATDPLNSDRYAVTELPYQIMRDQDGGSRESGAREVSRSDSPVSSVGQPGNTRQTIQLNFGLTHQEASYFQGERVGTILTPENIPAQISEQATIARYHLTDSEGNRISYFSREVFLRNGQSIENALEIPLYVKPGRYKVGVTVVLDGIQYSQEQEIVVAPLSVLKLSSGRDVTYDEFMWNLGWISFVALATILLWLFFVFYEYWLFMKGRLYVDEHTFKRAGYFSRL